MRCWFHVIFLGPGVPQELEALGPPERPLRKIWCVTCIVSPSLIKKWSIQTNFAGKWLTANTRITPMGWTPPTGWSPMDPRPHLRPSETEMELAGFTSTRTCVWCPPCRTPKIWRPPPGYPCSHFTTIDLTIRFRHLLEDRVSNAQGVKTWNLLSLKEKFVKSIAFV